MAWADCLARYDEEFESDWSKLNIDSSQVKAPLGGKKPEEARQTSEKSALCPSDLLPGSKVFLDKGYDSEHTTGILIFCKLRH